MDPRTGDARSGWRRLALGLLSLVGLLVGASVALGPARFDILGPHLGAPAILRPGDQLTIELLSSTPLWQPELRVELAASEESYPLAVGSVQWSRAGARASVLTALPAELPAGGFDLRVTAPAVGASRPRAVQIVNGYPQEVRILQLADLPLVGDRGPGDAEMDAIVEEVNLIAPDLVLISGDLVYLRDEDCYRRLIEYLGRLDAPTILAPGNHDYQSWGTYLRYFVRSHHVVDFGHLYLVTLNTGHRHDQVTRSQFRWLREVMAEREGRNPILQTHYPVFGPSSIKSLADDISREMIAHGGELALSGHLHQDAIFDGEGRPRDRWDFPGPKFSVTGPAGGQDLRSTPSGEFSYPGYRLITMAGGQVVAMTYDSDGDGVRDAASSYPFGRVRATHPEPGTAVISNELNEPIPRARVRIVAQGNHPGLRPDRGRVVEILTENGSTVYATEIDLAPQSLTVVRLQEPETP